MKDEFERIVNFGLPFDKRHKNPKKNYGIGSLQIWFILKKQEKAVQVLISTCLYPLEVIREYERKGESIFTHCKTFDCWDVRYHSDKPMFEGHDKTDCHILKQGFCYYDGSSLRGADDKVAENFMEHGDKWIWDYLEKEWDLRFGEQ